MTVAGRAIHRLDQYWVTGNFALHCTFDYTCNRGKMRRHALLSAWHRNRLEHAAPFFKKCSQVRTCVEFAVWPRSSEDAACSAASFVQINIAGRFTRPADKVAAV